MEQGIGALTSDAGRVAQSKAQQMQKGGASLDQIQQDLYGSVMKGLLPFQVAAELFQQLKQPPKEPAPPPTGTVVNDMAKVLAGRSSGVASLPAPNMDQAQFAGGGIVAFAGGSVVPSGGTTYPVVPYRPRAPVPRASSLVPASAPTAASTAATAGRWSRLLMGKGPWLTAAALGLSTLPYFLGDDEKVEAEKEETTNKPPEKYEMPANAGVPQVAMPNMNTGTPELDKEIARRRTELAGLKPKDRQAYIDEEKQLLEEAGLGKIRDQREAALNKRQAEYEQEKGKTGLMSLARAGFEMASNASQPGATFFGAAANGALQGLEHYNTAKEHLRQVDAGIQDAQFQLAEADGLRNYAAMQGGAQLKREADKTFYERSAGLSALVIGREEAQQRLKVAEFQAQAQVAIANVQLLADAGKNDLARQLAQMIDMSTKFWSEGKPDKAQAYMDRAQAIVTATAPQVLSKKAGMPPNMGGGAGVDPDQWGTEVGNTAPSKSED